MPRIFKGIESELRLLLHPCILTGEITDIKVALFTNDPSVAIEFTDRYTIDDNILTLKVPTWAFGTMEDGVINYVIQGMHNDDAFITDRQSNYYLKTPTDYIPEEMPEEVVLGELTTMIVENGVFEYTPSDVDAWNKATIEVNVPDTNGSFDEGYDKGKNDGYDSGYQDGYNAGQPIKYNTIADIYGSPSDSTVNFKGLVALSFAYGSGYFILFTDHTGSILLKNYQDHLMVGDECVVTAKLRRTDTSYISFLGDASIEVLSSNNYVVMPTDAVELTNVDELYIPNENGYAEMKYLYVDGKVGDRLSEDFIRLETDASSEGYINLRGNFKDWAEKLKEGDSIRVYMFTENSSKGFVVTDIIELGTEGGTCNLGEGEIYLTTNDAGFYELYAAEDGYDGWSKFYVTLENGGAIKIHKAEELIQWFNDGGDIDFGAYCYVGGKITDITEVSMEWGNATYTLDNGFSVYRGKWIDGNPFDEDQIKVGAYIVVYGIIQEHNGVLGFKANSQVIAYQECEGGEVVSCNIQEYKWVRPSMADRAENGDIYIYPDEGYDAVGYIDLDPNDIYNEGYNEGKIAGKAEGGDLNIGEGYIGLTENERGQTFELIPSNDGYDAYSKVTVELHNFDLGGDANIYDALSVHQLLMDGVISYGNRYIFKGQITEIQRIRPEYGDARYTLDGSLNIYNGQTMGYDLQTGDNVIVYGTLSEYNGAPQLSAGSIIKALWREGGSCNLEDKWVTPSMGERDDNGLIVVDQSEGYDGLDRVVIDPTTIYNEGIEEGKNQGGGSGNCNLGTLDITLTDPYALTKDASEDGYDGYNQVIVRPNNIIAQEKENAINEFKNQMQEITITENGTYSIDDAELVNSITFDGNSYFDTGIVPTENIKIEVCVKVTDGNDAGVGGIIIGGGIDPVESINHNGSENRGIAIGMGAGAIYGVWGTTRSHNNPYDYEKTTTVVLQKTDDSWSWGGEKGSFGASTLYIGGYNRNGEEVEEKFIQSIVYIKIWTNKDDDSTMTLFRPKNMAQGGFGLVNSEGTEYNYVENIGDGTTTYVEEFVNTYPYGFKRVEVNVPSVQDQVNGYYYCPLILGDSGFGEAAKSWNADMVAFNNYDGDIIEDKLYVPTSNNKNEFRTKEKARFVQRLPSDVSIIGSMEFGAGVEYFVTNEGKQFTNLTDLTIGPDMNTVKFGPSTFPTLKRIWCFSETDSIDVYFSMGSYFYDSGTLYLKNHNQETEWKTSLPNGWTIVLL